MATYTVETPRGRRLTIQSDSPENATRLADQWDLEDHAVSEAQRFGVNPETILKQMRQESGGRQNAVSPKGARGPMQLMPGTARDMGVNPDDPYANVTGGIRYFKKQLDAFGGDERLALAAYNAGPEAVRRHGGVPPYPETQNYVHAIMGGGPSTSGHGPEDFDGSEIFGGAGGDPSAGPAGPGDFDGAEIFAAPTSARRGPPAAVSGADGRPSSADKRAPIPQRQPGPPAPQVPQRPGYAERQAFGFGKQLAVNSDRVWNRINDNPALSQVADLTGQAFPAFALARGAQRALVHDRAMPAIAKAEAGGMEPGGLGSFAGDMASTAAMGGNPVVAGFGTSALLSDKNDLPGVLKDGAFGAVAGRLGAGASDLLQIGARKLLSKVPQVMDLPGLQQAVRDAYAKVDASGFAFPKTDVKALAEDFARSVAGSALSKSAKDDAREIINYTRQLASGDLPLSQLEKLRGDIYDAMVAKGGDTARLGSQFRAKIDALIDAVPNGDVRAARAANATFMKARDVADSVRSGQLAAASTNSGRNVVNAQRAKLRPTIDPLHSREITNWLPDEAAAAERAVMGGPVGNFYREAGNFFRNPMVGAGAMSLGGLAGMHGGPQTAIGGGLAAPAAMQMIGGAFRRAAEKETAKDIAALTRIVAGGGTKSALAAVPTQMSHAAEVAISRLIRPALVGSGALMASQARAVPQRKRP